MTRRMSTMTAYLEPELHEELRRLSKRSKVPIAALLRESVHRGLPVFTAELRRNGVQVDASGASDEGDDR